VTAAVTARTGAALATAARDVRRAWRWPATAAAAGLGLAVLAPLVLDSLQVQGLASWLYLALAATGLGFAVGLAGIPSLGQGAFMAVGAFTAALLRAKTGAGPLEAALAGLVVSTLAGFVLGLGFVRLGRVLFAVATWLVAWLVALGLAAFPSISGGTQGLVISRGSIAGIPMTATIHYELALVLVALSILALFAITRGVPGLALSALRQRRAAALALGVRATRLRLGAFVASAAIGGLAGALSVQLAGIADAAGYGPFLSFKLFASVLLGGMTTAAGGLAGLGVISGIAHFAHWLGARPFGLMVAGRTDPKSFYHAFRAMDDHAAHAFIDRVWAGINLPNLRDHIVQDRDIARGGGVLVGDKRQPQVVVGESGPNAAAGWRVPPVLDVALDELTRRRAQDLRARDLGRGVDERHHVLQLVAEAVGAAGLIEGRACPDAAGQRLIQQPAVQQ